MRRYWCPCCRVWSRAWAGANHLHEEPGRDEGIEPRDSGHSEAAANLGSDPSRRPALVGPGHPCSGDGCDDAGLWRVDDEFLCDAHLDIRGLSTVT